MEITLLVGAHGAADALAAQMEQRAHRIASGPTLAHGRIDRLLQGSFDCTMKELMARERTAFRESAATADFAEGTRAFMDKRRPRFTGK